MTPLWTSNEVLNAIKGTPSSENFWEANGVSIDSRTIMPGNIFKKAERLLTTIGDNIRFSHVQEAKLPTLFVGMLQWERCLQYSKENPNMNWPFEKTLVDTFNVFAEIYKTNSITHLSENGNNITWLKKELGIKNVIF